jgi:hypothetical protein
VINFITTLWKSAGPLHFYLTDLGRPLAGLFRPLSYAELFAARELPPGAYCFADLEMLEPAERERAAAIWQELAGRGTKLLNHPARSLTRFDLLRKLNCLGINRFDVHRLGDKPTRLRYPVFLRNAKDHNGSVTPLLEDAGALERAVTDLRKAGRMPADPLIVEYCHASDADGVFVKYGAFVVGDTIIPRHVFFSRHWMVKEWDMLEPRHVEAERDYVTTNPHADRLREIAAIAGITYGRIDYGFSAGALQVWEINTNPMMTGRMPSTRRRRSIITKLRNSVRREGPRAWVHRTFADRIAREWWAFDEPAT